MADHQQSEFTLFDEKPSALKRRFLDWDRPLLDLACSALVENWKQGPLDLSNLLVLVPTRNASRRLRERLAIEAAERDTGVLPPLILNPDDLLLPPADSLPIASKAQLVTTWVDLLLEIALSEFENLFPVAPIEQNFAWALATAQEFISVQSLLGEGAHNASYAAKVLTDHDLEGERWQEFAQLERRVFARLEKAKLQPRSQARRLALEHWQPPAEIEKLILLGVPDPPPALEPLLDRIAQHHLVEVWIHASQDQEEHFDHYGKPNTTWNHRELTIREEDIFQASSPSAQADLVCERLLDHEKLHQVAAISVPDAEVIPPLQKALTSQGWASFNPAGNSFRQDGLSHLLRTLYETVSSQRLTNLRELLRIPGVAESAGNFNIPENKKPFLANEILDTFDRFHEAHLCETLQDARQVLEVCEQNYPPVSRTLHWFDSHLKSLQKEPLARALPRLLTEIYERVELLNKETFTQVAQTVTHTLAEVDALKRHSTAESFQLLLTLLDEQMLASKRPLEAIELPGWLELPWEDAPYIILTGCNEGLVPESIQSHAWLPNQARGKLGLRDNDARQARDTYLMAALIASRAKGGQVDFLFGRVNGSNDPLRPSRLLLSAPSEKLPQRVQTLFTESNNETVPQAWNIAWQLTPPKPDPARFQKLSVTSFQKYLACPFRYYLEFALRMRQPDLERTELNARDFGTLVHNVLEDFAKSSAAKSESEKEIAECFQDLLTTRLATTYSPNLPAPLLIQADSIRQRLSWWAAHEARERSEGWTILETETDLAPEESPFLLDEMVIRGQIDRIESHPHQGLRILDFKTKAEPKKVVSAHLRKQKRGENLENFPKWQLVDIDGKTQCWSNLQVPLYVLALAERFPNQNTVAGYAQLGATKNAVHLDLWEDLDKDLLESARRCALGVIDSIRKEVFWPPAEKPEYDNFASLLFGDPEQAIDPINLLPSRCK